MSNNELVAHRIGEIERHAEKMASTVEEMSRNQTRAEAEYGVLANSLNDVRTKVDDGEKRRDERHQEIMKILTGDGKQEIGYVGRLTRVEDTIKLIKYSISVIFVAIVTLLGHLVYSLITGKR